MFSCSYDKSLKIWDVKNNFTEIATLLGHTSAVYSMSLSNNEEKIISGSNDKTIRIWDAQ